MYTLHKQEKICSKKILDELFIKGQSFIIYPFRVSYLKYDLNTIYPAQVLFIVSKKRFKKAHDRNRIKRLMREAYRIQKYMLYNILEKNNIKLVISINYVGRELTNFQEISNQMKLILSKLISFVEK